MTTRREAPLLDILISRTDTTGGGAADAVSLRYADKVAEADVTTGAYFHDDGELVIGLVDSDGVTANVPPVGTQIALAYRNDFNQSDSAVVTVVTATASAVSITIVYDIVGAYPNVGFISQMTLTYSVTTPEVNVTTTYWARRNDFQARDFVASGNAGLLAISDSRYIVRRNPVWVEGAAFTDERSNGRTVQGVSEYSGGPSRLSGAFGTTTWQRVALTHPRGHRILS